MTKKLLIKFKKNQHLCKTIELKDKTVDQILIIKKGIDRKIDSRKYFTVLNFNLF